MPTEKVDPNAKPKPAEADKAKDAKELSQDDLDNVTGGARLNPQPLPP